MTTKEIFTSYFDLLKETLTKHELMEKPAQIYNCNESGMPLQQKCQKLLHKEERRKFDSDCQVIKHKSLPPMVIFAGKNFNYELSDGEVPGTFFGISD